MKNRLESFREIFFKSIFKSLLVPFFALILIVSFIYFLQISTVINKQKEHFIDQFHSSIQNSIEYKTKEIETNLNNIETSLLGIQSTIENYYDGNQRDDKNKRFDFAKSERGFWYKPQQYRGSDVVFMPQTNPTEQDFNDAYNLEKIDSFIIPLVDRNNIIVAAWINQENYLVRYYPYFDMKNILEPNMDIKAFNFYYEADPLHNPQMINIWTTPYLDPAMKGWLISRVAPIRKNDQFLGVFGIDINIDAILSILPKTYNNQEIKTFITNSNGDVLSIKSDIKEYFELIKPDVYKDGKSLSSEVIQPESYNIFHTNDSSLNEQIKLLFESATFQKIDHKNKSYFVYKSEIKNTNWFLFYMIDENKILDKLDAIEKENLQLTIFALASFIIVFILIVVNLKHSVKNSIRDISQPIEALSEATKNIENFHLHEHEKIFEIANLYKNFKIMAQEITQHNNELENRVQARTIELNEKIETIEKLQEKLIEQNIHDHLTTLFNRRYGDEVLKRESEKAILESTTLSVVMIDIDYFKQVNDNYGHQVGDAVLIKLSSVLKSNIRARDVAVRYGGEEFLLVLPDCTKEDAFTLMEVIQKDYQKEIKETMHLESGTTLSAGISSLPQDSVKIEEIIKFADRALYVSKESGRNRITTFTLY
jgi:diguanylate cyclase (GGDEF)-like protein